MSRFLLWRSTEQAGVQIVPRSRYQVFGKKQAGNFSRSEQKKIDHERYLLLYLRMFFPFLFFLVWYCVPVSVVSSVGTAFPMEVWWRYYFLLYIVVHTTTSTQLLAHVCCACRVQQCMYSSHRTVPLLVDTQHTCRLWLVLSVLFLRFRPFFFRVFSLSMYLGCWRVYVMLDVPSAMAWRCVVQSACEHCMAMQYLCVVACDRRACISRVYNRHGHWVCWTSMSRRP